MSKLPLSEEYRTKAFECLSQVDSASDLGRDLWLTLAIAYANLADLSGRNARTDLAYEAAPKQVKLG